MSLIEQVTQTIIHALTSDLSEFLSDRFGLDSNEVSDAVRDYLGYNSTPASPIKKPVRASKKSSPPIKAASSGIKTCQFRITRGTKEGQMCGTTIRGSGDFCSKHKNRKTIQTKSKKTSIGNDTNITRNAKAKCWVISGTLFVVKSPRNKTVIGKIAGTKVVSLTDTDKKKVQALKIPIEDTEEEIDE
ncbi:hypothetical protein LCGC14_3161220 [marine sediment metagenome]|uniref:Uncharacterized protein n=1 Tax=marine sediment metagenome TaxID=412755 RepID=A0A0F8VR25_9ZZZZ